MAIDFNEKDVIHHIIAKFYPTSLPTVSKKFIARPVMQEVLDVHEIASKAATYNINTPASVIEEGLLAAEKLIPYLVADNYKIYTEIFRINVRIPGQFDGSETHLQPGVHPELNITAGDGLRRHIRDNARVRFDGIEDSQGFIGKLLDGATGRVDEVVTRGNILTISGYGLKVEADETHASLAGVFLVTDSGLERDAEAPSDGEVSPATVVETPVTAIVVNEPRTLKVLIPTSLLADKAYTVVVRTQGSVKRPGRLQKEMREVKTDFPLAVL